LPRLFDGFVAASKPFTAISGNFVVQAPSHHLYTF
jgi:hypothetical protein